MNAAEFAEKVCGVKLLPYQRSLLRDLAEYRESYAVQDPGYEAWEMKLHVLEHRDAPAKLLPRRWLHQIQGDRLISH